MSFFSSIVGLDAFDSALAKVAEQAAAGARENVAKAAAKVEANAKANFEGAHKRGQPHVGGDKPNIVSGSLRRSIRPDAITRVNLAEYRTTVGPRMIYARRVELGFNGSTPHPYFAPGARDAQREFSAIAAGTWRAFLFGH